jgi:hypothetical protein
MQSTVVFVGGAAPRNRAEYAGLIQNDTSHFRYAATDMGGTTWWCAGRTAASYLRKPNMYTPTTFQTPGDSMEFLFSGRLGFIGNALAFPSDSGFIQALRVSRVSLDGAPCYKISSSDTPVSPTGTAIPFITVVVGVRDRLIRKLTVPMSGSPYATRIQWLFYQAAKPFPAAAFQPTRPKGARLPAPMPLAP